MIRVSGLLDQLSSEIVEPTDDGLPPRRGPRARAAAVQEMEARQISCLVDDLLPKLAAAGISILTWDDLNDAQREACERALPAQRPARSSRRSPSIPGHPFPFLSNLSLNLAVEVKNPETGETKFARVKVPQAMPRLLAASRARRGQEEGQAREGRVPPPRVAHPGEPRRALSRPRDRLLAPLSRDARRRHRDPGGRGLRPPRDDRAGGAAPPLRRGRAPRGRPEDAQARAEAPLRSSSRSPRTRSTRWTGRSARATSCRSRGSTGAS